MDAGTDTYQSGASVPLDLLKDDAPENEVRSSGLVGESGREVYAHDKGGVG